MKKLQFLFITLYASVLLGQNYEPIKTFSSVHFLDNSSGIIMSYHISNYHHNGNTIEYQCFPMIRPVNTENSDLFIKNGNSWLGKIVSFPDNRWFFYNYKNIPVIIPVLAKVNDTWTLYQFENGSTIVGKILSINRESFLGIQDSVKSISLTCYNTDGSIAESIVNDFILKLSKNHGLISICDFYNFPDFNPDPLYQNSAEIYNIIGFEYPQTGFHNFGFDEIFDFMAGDEIHDYYEYNLMANGLDQEYTINRILEFSMINYTVYLKTERCRKNLAFDWVNPVQVSHGVDTISNHFNHQEYAFLDKLSYVPTEIFGQISYIENYQNMKKKSSNLFYPVNGDTLAMLMVDGQTESDYYPGLGGPYGYSGGFEGEGHHNIVYYKKGDLEWGVPYSCPQLLQVLEEKQNCIRIFPNPTEETITIEGIERDYTLQIFDVLGKMFFNKRVCFPYTCDVSAFPSGLYEVRIISDIGMISERLMKK